MDSRPRIAKCPLLDTGKNSVKPCVSPTNTAFKYFI